MSSWFKALGLDPHEVAWPSYVANVSRVPEFGIPRSSHFLPRWTKNSSSSQPHGHHVNCSFYFHVCICVDSSQLALESSLVPHIMGNRTKVLYKHMT